MGSTTIEWTDDSWNPVTGCTKISPGCGLGPDGAPVGAGCYAERIAERFRGQPGFETGFDLRLRPEKLDEPARWRKPRMIFVNSMSDLFHKDTPDEFIGRVFDTMERVSRHRYQVLTKRSSLMRDFVRARYGSLAPPHIWLGVSVEDGLRKSRVRHLQETPASVRFLSVEPLIGRIGRLDLSGIHWVIVGGESGPGFRPMKPEWACEVRDQCVAQDVPFFFKQWGGVRPKSGGRTLDGREWGEYPRATAVAGQEARHG